MSLVEIEERMGFPRDYLDFTTWYLASKKFIAKADNADFTLTIEGVDFIESRRATLPVLDKLLTAGSHSDDHEVHARLNVPDPLPPDNSRDEQFPVVVLATEISSHQ